MTRATSADVAALAGVSRATVSYVLNDAKNQTIPEHTRQRVLDAAGELRYRPNVAAKSLAAGSSGMVVFSIPNVHLGELLVVMSSHLTSELAAKGLMLVVHFETSGGRSLMELVGDLHPRAVINLIEPRSAIADALNAAGVATYTAFSPENASGLLNAQIGETQVAHFVDRGHRVLAFAGSTDSGLAALVDMRFDAVSAACAERGLRVPVRSDLDLRSRAAAQIAREWKASGVTAVCAYNDDVALMVLAGIREAGLHCPSDLAVIGVDDAAAGYSAEPPLTSVALNSELVARTLTVSVLASMGIQNRRTLLPEESPASVELIVRASS